MGAKPPPFLHRRSRSKFFPKGFFAGRAGVRVWANRTAICGTRSPPLRICCGPSARRHAASVELAANLVTLRWELIEGRIHLNNFVNICNSSFV